MQNQNPMGKILLVDDDVNITELLKFNLTSEGFGVDIEKEAAIVDIDSLLEYRLIIVDAMHQAMTGLELCSEIKKNKDTENLPVLICAMPDGEDDIINAFDHGADDYISKPFSLRELIARIKAVLRRHPMRSTGEIRMQSRELTAPGIDLSINTETQKVTAEGAIVPLTKTEFAILLQLFKHRNSFFSREDICKAVWNNNDASSNVRIVDTNISRLRKKLGEIGKHIINRYGMGYAFVDKVM